VTAVQPAVQPCSPAATRNAESYSFLKAETVARRGGDWPDRPSGWRSGSAEGGINFLQWPAEIMALTICRRYAPL